MQARSTPPRAAVERSPSLGLLLRHAERSVVPDGAREHPDGCLDERVLEVEARDQLQSDAALWGLSASDAWDGVHPDEAVDAAHQRLVVLEDADAEKSADPVQGGLVQDAWFLPEDRHGPAEAAVPGQAASRPQVEHSLAVLGRASAQARA